MQDKGKLRISIKYLFISINNVIMSRINCGVYAAVSLLWLFNGPID